MTAAASHGSSPHFGAGRLHTFEFLSDGRVAELVWSVRLFHEPHDPSVGIEGGYFADGVELEDILVDGASLTETAGLAEGATCPLIPGGYRDRADEATMDERSDIPGELDRMGRERAEESFDSSEWRRLDMGIYP